VIQDKKVNLLSDPLIAQYLQDLLRNVRLKALEAMCKPYKAVRLQFLAEKMDVNLEEIRSLLAELILEERIEGAIDQVQGVLELNSAELEKA
jgi:COP9 signalosome complex subunit 2